ncbi:putative aminopeptidase [Tritrichomonas foetus]|uniref:Aminopeptidase n=1 Tax=Tritrichomonas foetus TaxID=1144522 RepID=A0A1J4KFE5_9EUKA|nr:putative aminopeptidase [Tritrichomonas foetus]|eukprot:OHT08093.1 putative aminopeptidase [Tritrichomonas foetus]
MIDDTSKMAADAIDLTSEIIDKFGPRLAGSDACLKAADFIHEKLSKVCHSAHVDKFDIHPAAFLDFLNYMCISYFIGVAFMWLNMPKFTLLFSVIMFLILYLEYLLYFETYDSLYKNSNGKNVYGVIEPQGEVKNTVIFSGHHDSAHIFNFYNQPKFYLVREVIFFLITHIFILFMSFYVIYDHFYGFESNSVFYKAKLVFTFLILGIVPMLFFTNPKGTPGAGDNLAAVSMGIQLANKYAENRPKSTRLIFASYDGEECGLRGSRAFFTQHKKDFDIEHTWNYNIDCSYYIEDLKFLTTDINGSVRLSKELTGKCINIAHKLGYVQAHECGIPFLAGATDAAEAAKIGIKATTVLGVPFDGKTKVPPYHTMRDVPSAIEPAVLKAMMQIFIEFVDQLENETK